jgi:hypothetical protein
MSAFLKKHPEVKSISIQMETGNLASAGIIVDDIPASLHCERFICHERFDLWEDLSEAVTKRRTEGMIYHQCQAMQKMNRTDYRECLAQLRGRFWIEYREPSF